MKKFKRNGIIIFVITLVLIWFILKDNFNESIKLLMTSKLSWIFVSLIVFFIYVVLESLVTKILVNQYKKDYTLKKCIHLTLMTKFFNGITPFATGGQPLQVYELKKEGVKITDGTVIMVEHFVIFQTSVVILAFLAIIINTIFGIVQCEPFLNSLAILGFGVNILLLLVVYFISISPNISKKILKSIVSFLYKIKIIKNKNASLEKCDKACDEYYQGYTHLSQNKKLVWRLILIEIISLVVWFTTPVFIFKSLGYMGNVSVLICIMISIYIFFVGSYIPIPGGSGGMEYAFVGYFTFYITSSYLTLALILWRFVNYYLPMIVGGIIFNFRKNQQ